ncbi:MAG: DNA-binding protein [Terriglobales bacterium]
MPDQETIDRAREDAREGKSASTQAGEFVREEMDHIREGKHGARSSQQAIAIGLSKARRAGVKLAAPKGSAALKKKADQDERASQHPRRKVSAKRSRATEKALQREPRTSASKSTLSRQARKAAAERGKKARSAAAMRAARTRKAA